MARRPVASKGLRPGELTGQPRHGAIKVTGFHRHGCSVCGRRYDDSCDMPEENGRCRFCRGVAHPPTPWERSYAPQECCRRLARLATTDERGSYRLAGPGPWWICQPGRGCARTHPYDPRTTRGTGTP